MEKKDIINHGVYEVCIFSEREQRFVYVNVDPSSVWEYYKAYRQLGETRAHFPIFWDFLVMITRHNYDSDK